MQYKISKLHIKILTWIAKKIVIQSYNHKDNIIMYYKIIAQAATDEFMEDNKVTLHGFLSECHEISLKKVIH
jgi:hypothetical protein